MKRFHPLRWTATLCFCALVLGYRLNLGAGTDTHVGLLVPQTANAVALLIGQNSGATHVSVPADEEVQLDVNVTSDVNPNQTWFAFTYTKAGIQQPLFLLTAGGTVVQASQVKDFSTVTYPFESGPTQTFVTVTTMADLGLAPGDTLTYGYAVSATDISGVTVPNYVVITTTSDSGNSSVTYPIVDTGQTTFYGNVAALSTAPKTPSDPFYGQDAQFTGLQPAYQNNGDGTITDLNTGLMWVAARGSKVTWDQAVAGASACTVGGYTDWRMPTIKELYSLINFTGKSGSTDATCIPYIDTNYFGFAFGDTNPNESTTTVGNRVIDGQDWSATKYVSTTMQGDETVFGVNFIDGRIKGYPVYDSATGEPNTKYVRYVRGNPDYGKNQFVDNQDGTITDEATGLMWAQADSGTGMDWADALAWVQQQNAADYLGHNDWRLPNAKELQSIVDYTRSPDTTDSAAIDPLFQSTAITNEGGEKDWPWYWTGTTHLDTMGAVYVAFGRALGWMKFGSDAYYTLADVHGAGAQRSDPKSGSPTDYYLGVDKNGNPVYGRGPQGDVIRIDNFVRLVRDTQ